MRRLALLALCLVVGCRAGPPTPQPLATWVALTGGNQLSIRTITRDAACPEVAIDGAKQPLTQRAAPDADFPVRVCEVSAPVSARAIDAGTGLLPVLPPKVDRIVVFGDTGCRLKGTFVQDCNNPAAWPFAEVARQAAAKHPDLVIHVGDYHYRETPCPAGNAGCAGTPSGDNWGVWSADFFEPAAPLLKAAPWIFVRGNHELCGRGGKGWFRFLDAAPTVLDCPAMTSAYTIHLDGLDLAVLDSAATEDISAPPDLVAQFARNVASAATAATAPFWILTHRPIWALSPVPGQTDLSPLNRTEQAAVDPMIPPALAMVMAGHVHTFASYDFGGARPAQLVVGTGGSTTDTMALPAGSKVMIDGMTAGAFALTRYAYLVLDRAAGGWDGTLYQAGDDQVLARCRIAGRALACH